MSEWERVENRRGQFVQGLWARVRIWVCTLSVMGARAGLAKESCAVTGVLKRAHRLLPGDTFYAVLPRALCHLVIHLLIHSARTGLLPCASAVLGADVTTGQHSKGGRWKFLWAPPGWPQVGSCPWIHFMCTAQ